MLSEEALLLIKRTICLYLVLVFAFLFVPCAFASYGTFQFEDTRFAGDFTTDNLDRIIEEYELYDGWYWTTLPRIDQSFHGAEDQPGWTDTAVKKKGGTAFIPDRYGCRWLANRVNPDVYGGMTGGYGECFGFAQFIGYLLSGDYNPTNPGTTTTTLIHREGSVWVIFYGPIIKTVTVPSSILFRIRRFFFFRCPAVHTTVSQSVPDFSADIL